MRGEHVPFYHSRFTPQSLTLVRVRPTTFALVTLIRGTEYRDILPTSTTLAVEAQETIQGSYQAISLVLVDVEGCTRTYTNTEVGAKELECIFECSLVCTRGLTRDSRLASLRLPLPVEARCDEVCQRSVASSSTTFCDRPMYQRWRRPRVLGQSDSDGWSLDRR